MFFADEQLARSIGSSELIKVKFELDTNPPKHAMYETKYRLLPIPYEITMYDMPSLFAGKIHAVLCRAWKNRIKGRDLYDYVFYISRKTKLNLDHLSARLAQSGFDLKNEQLTIQDVKEMLIKRFKSIDFAQARQDVIPFIQNPSVLDIWSADFFCKITDDFNF